MGFAWNEDVRVVRLDGDVVRLMVIIVDGGVVCGCCVVVSVGGSVVSHV